MYQIVTDTSANLPWSFVQEHDIPVVPLYYIVDGEERTQPPGEWDGAEYYESMRQGKTYSTSQIPPQRYIEYMEPFLQKEQDILFLGMSSGISGSFASAKMAADELKESFPQRRIETFDTLAASLGEGMFVIRAVENQQKGMSLDETIADLTAYRSRLYQQLMVDDLNYLKRTGRASGAVALVGSILNIKPILKGSEEGLLVVSAKIRGRRNALNTMAERYRELVVNPQDQVVGIAHTGCPEDAALLAEMIRGIAEPKDILTVAYEPVTGAHAGPDGVALFFEGAEGVRKNY